MRRRLVLVSAAVTAMVAVAFLAPLFLLVRDLVHDRAVSRAERDVEEVARVLALLSPDRSLEEAVAIIGDDPFFTAQISIVTEEGDVLLGPDLGESEDLGPALGPDGESFLNAEIPGGEAVYTPVPLADGPTVVVRGFVPDEVLTDGVVRSWVVLGALGVLLTAIAIVVADRLGRSIVRPVLGLSEATVRLGDGDLSVRVLPDGPEEINEAGAQFNRLAERITSLLQSEREQAADLSHRLRTPLTAVRLDAEALPEGEDKERLLDDLAELERMVSHVIEEARRPMRTGTESVDLNAVVTDRVEFWRPLADEQRRPITIERVDEPLVTRLDHRDAEALIDAALGNIFAHTEEGVAIHIALGSTRGRVILRIEDAGPGFPEMEVLERGTSGGGSTGLGLDIIRRTAELAGGRLDIGKGRTLPGAALVLSLPRVRARAGVLDAPRTARRSPVRAPRPDRFQSSWSSSSLESSPSSSPPSDSPPDTSSSS